MNSENKKQSGKILYFFGGTVLGALLGMICVIVIFWGFITVKNVLNKAGINFSQNQNTKIEDVNISEDSIISGEFLMKIAELEKLINDKFYLHEVSKEDLETGAYRGIVESLGDVYSEYYTPEELESLLSETDGTYYGIGAYVGLDEATNLAKISSVIKGSPAEAAKLRPDDLIYKVNGESTTGLGLSEVVKLIKGPEGTEVEIVIIRGQEELTMTLKRAKVEAPTVETKMLNNNMGYLKLTEFDAVSTKQFEDGMKTLRDSGMQGMILDLRSNPGGNLKTVVDIAKMMLPKGMIVYTEDNNGNRDEYTCNGKNELDIPLVVLIDGNSASASEILAGAIQDYGIGTLVGTTSFGKGIVQGIMPLKDGSGVKLTISSYFTPNGRNIHGKGIEPDVVCEFDSERYYNSNGQEDNQLEKAMEILKEKMNQ